MTSRHSWASLCARFELLQAPPDLGRLAVVVVDGRVGHALLGLPVGALDLLDELLHGHGIKVSAALDASSRRGAKPESLVTVCY